jgi:NTP pyrophosphatase (non-canonical NTP hydrolase)
MNSIDYIKNAIKTESINFTDIDKRLSHKSIKRLLHGGMGLSTEAGEFLDALKKHIFYGKKLDKVNLTEEMGDIFWYIAIIADELEINFEEIMNKNIKKLKIRYGDKFSELKASQRDLQKERKILEQ